MAAFNMNDVFGSIKDYREERLDKFVTQVLEAKSIHELTSIKPKELDFYMRLRIMGSIVEFFKTNEKNNISGEIKSYNAEMVHDLEKYMLGLSRSRDGWFIEQIFKYLRYQEQENVTEEKLKPK